jgi:hypothetical protein
VVEEPAHAAAATVVAFVTVEAERVAAVVRAVRAAVATVMVGMTSKHVVLRSCFVISKL